MRQTLFPGVRALLIGAISLGLSLPAVAATRNSDAPAKATVHKVHKKAARSASKATSKKVSHARKSHRASRVSRYGKQRTPVARMSAAERQRLATLANLPIASVPPRSSRFPVPRVRCPCNPAPPWS
ncbi:MAG TPA: hypothetical protein VFV15_06985 [Moraxellaceae bacterium]|nr:hypothetical protein [Moraxellaceae bacterium]